AIGDLRERLLVARERGRQLAARLERARERDEQLLARGIGIGEGEPRAQVALTLDGGAEVEGREPARRQRVGRAGREAERLAAELPRRRPAAEPARRAGAGDEGVEPLAIRDALDSRLGGEQARRRGQRHLVAALRLGEPRQRG